MTEPTNCNPENVAGKRCVDAQYSDHDLCLETAIGRYRWIENWITIPESPLGKKNGRTHGVAVLKNGNIVIFHQADPAVLIYSPDGELQNAWGCFPGAHGLTLVEENGVEYLWLVDEVTCEVVKTDLNGTILARLSRPEHPAYREGAYLPTWVAVAEERFGGNGDIWLADGYGSSLVHRFDRNGAFISTLDGTSGSGRFSCPHGISFHTKGSEPLLYVADRGNRRFQVYSQEGCYQRSFGAEFLDSPDVAVPWGDRLIVPELCAGITILDAEEHLLAQIAFQSINTLKDWPNERSHVRPGFFNSPHSAAADASGNLYVVEWITGGRVTKLERQI